MTECSSCKGPSGFFDGLCLMCRAHADGEQCTKCNSLYVYIHAFMSDDKPRVPLCKPCCYKYIKLCGYMDDITEILARSKEREEKKQASSIPSPNAKPTVKAEVVDPQSSLTFEDA